ncbi:hypothetical protein BSKO_06066 [Bryopsis sp. KO-2023]|nr:hypothetical protein BSKO_06066 [Bryopsis sp. KO-2023]
MTIEAYAINEDGTAKDPAAFRTALLADEARMKLVDEDEEMAKVVRGEDTHAFQQLLKTAYESEKRRMERNRRCWAERTIDAQRASAPVPRDTVQLYKQLHESGLQYGPAFRLLRNVHTPEEP